MWTAFLQLQCTGLLRGRWSSPVLKSTFRPTCASRTATMSNTWGSRFQVPGQQLHTTQPRRVRCSGFDYGPALQCTLRNLLERMRMARPTNPVKFIAELSSPNSSTAMAADKEASEALTGRILQTDTNDSGVDQQSSPKWVQKRPLEIGVVLLLLALLGTVVGLAVGLSRSRNNQGVDPACIHALGGGPVKGGGGLDSAAPAYCKEQLHAYADRNRGSYRREVDIAMLAAMATFGFAHKSSSHNTPAQQQHSLTALQSPKSTNPLPVSSSLHLSRSLLAGRAASSRPSEVDVAAADISASMSSSLLGLGGPVAAAAASAALTEGVQPPQPGRDKVVVFDIDETVLSNMDQILDPVTWPWDKWVAAAQAPALQPTLQYYRALCNAGYSVAFVTGRKEISRQSTMHNLEVEGYGKPCAEGPGPFYGPRQLQDDGVGIGVQECCYTALYLRQAGDTSLASVYKPGARKDLLQKGNMTLVALVGDQFSDLNGEVSAPYAFKLPNPFYYIL